MMKVSLDFVMPSFPFVLHGMDDPMAGLRVLDGLKGVSDVLCKPF